MTTRILVGDCRERMAELDAESVDSVVTDPPYELTSVSRNGSPRVNNPDTPFGRHNLQPKAGFMGMRWDGSGVSFDPETWASCLRVLKPGAHLLAFGGTRTVHRIASAIEDAGFEIRDQIAWLYGSGFPKSKNLEGEWSGWGTALKPAMEPIIVARKPFRGTVAQNVAAHGTGALNIDGCRIEGIVPSTIQGQSGQQGEIYGKDQRTLREFVPSELGRWPANVVLDEDAAAILDAQSGITTEKPRVLNRNGDRQMDGWGLRAESKGVVHGDTGGASRFFYCAKADRAERNIGLAGMPERNPHPDEPNGRVWDIPGSHSTPRANHHPTVKPVALMQWLVRLVTPPGGLVLDPFLGSGTTGIACGREGFDFIGIEVSAEYADIADRRIRGDAPLFADVEVA